MRRLLFLAAFGAGVFLMTVLANASTDNDIVLMAVAFFGTLLLGSALRSLEGRRDRTDDQDPQDASPADPSEP